MRTLRLLTLTLLNFLFSVIYRRWLWDSFAERYETVVRVKGWRTAIVESAGARKVISPCFLWFGCLTLALAATPVRAELTTDQAAAIKRTLAKTPAPELPTVVAGLVKSAPAADRSAVAKIAAKVTGEQRPGSLKAVLDVIPAENRPPITPGNENGNRPEIPPGLNKYASP
jgi:hypothetical protein